MEGQTIIDRMTHLNRQIRIDLTIEAKTETDGVTGKDGHRMDRQKDAKSRKRGFALQLSRDCLTSDIFFGETRH